MLGTGRRRIHIIGGPGSGKSSLARQLGGLLGISVHSLDLIAFEGVEFAERPLEQRLADVHRIAGEPAWITEGIFVEWTDELLRAADLIVWLDHLQWHVAIWRIVVRFVRLGAQEIGRQPGHRKFTRFGDYSRHLRQLVGVFFSSHAYYRSSVAVAPRQGTAEASRTATSFYLAAYMDKVVHCRSNQDIQNLISAIVGGAGEARPATNP